MSIRILPVTRPRQLRQFIQFRHHLYRGDPHYVPELYLSERAFLGRNNPFFLHSQATYFLAFSGKRPVGRIAAILNQKHLDRYKDHTGFFGFFDAEDDPLVAGALLDAAFDWLRQRGLRKVIGPENFTTNHAVGVLTQGFDQPAVVQMPYNKPYYEQLLTGQGLAKKMELYAYRFYQVRLPASFVERGRRIEGRLQKRGIRIRPVDFKRFGPEMEQLRRVYNAANEGHWGFVPLTPEEFRFLADDLRRIVRPENVLLAEREGQLVGYLVTVPDINQVLKQIPDGRLFPWGWAKLLARPRLSGSRMLILGILPAFRNLGIDWCFYARASLFYQRQGVEWTEACYVMQDNRMMNRIIQKIGGAPVKTYRLYGKEL